MFSQVTQIGSVYQLPPPVDSLRWCKLPGEVANSSSPAEGQDDSNFDRLLPTLFECFAIVFCGFLAGRCNVISQTDIKGLNDFTTYFTLPPLIFLNLVTINFSNVNWHFVLSVLLGKIAVFVLVALVTASTHKPLNLSYAGIYGIFCTQGNDFGLAYPIVASLYGSKHPLYQGYMYLIAPTSLLVTNPMGFFLMEAQRSRVSEDFGQKSNSFVASVLRTVGSVCWNVFRNPVVVVTLLGIAGNFLFRNGLPSILYGVLQILSSAFSAAVLFLLGFSVVRCGKAKSNSKEGLLIPAVLIIAKMLVSPLITRSIVAMLCSAAPDIDDLADYGFLYGMVPTGPIVLLFATEYCIRTEMMATTMVVCTALFGPAIFVLARMLSLKVRGIDDFAGELRMTMLVLSVLSILSCVWIGMCFVVGRKLKHRLYKITGFLLLSQVIMATGILMWSTIEKDRTWTAFLKVAFIAAGQLMSRLWITLLALTLMVNQRNKQSPFIQNLSWPMSFGFGIPAASVLMLLVLTAVGKCEPSLHTELPLFIYGSSEAIASIVVLSACLSVTTTSLVLYFRSLAQTWNDDCAVDGRDSSVVTVEHGSQKSADLKGDLVGGAEVAVSKMTKSFSAPLSDADRNKACKDGKLGYDSSARKHSAAMMEEVKKGLKVQSSIGGSQKMGNFRSTFDVVSLTSSKQVRSISCSSAEDDDDYDDEDGQNKRSRHLRHVILLILCCISMSVGLTISTWKLSSNQPNGLFVAMEFLDAVLNVGQGVFVFVVFWHESKYIVDPTVKWLRKVRRGFYNFDGDHVDDNTEQLCLQFRKYHWENCMRDLPKTLLMADQTAYRNCFTGSELVNWLMAVGLANNNMAAEIYGQRLVGGGLLRSANGAVQFHDSNRYLYELRDSEKYK